MNCSQIGCAPTGPNPAYSRARKPSALATPKPIRMTNGSSTSTRDTALTTSGVKTHQAASVHQPRRKSGARGCPASRSNTQKNTDSTARPTSVPASVGDIGLPRILAGAEHVQADVLSAVAQTSPPLPWRLRHRRGAVVHWRALPVAQRSQRGGPLPSAWKTCGRRWTAVAHRLHRRATGRRSGRHCRIQRLRLFGEQQKSARGDRSPRTGLLVPTAPERAGAIPGLRSSPRVRWSRTWNTCSPAQRFRLRMCSWLRPSAGCRLSSTPAGIRISSLVW